MAGSPHSDGLRSRSRAPRRGLLLGGALLLVGAFLAGPAAAQDPCAPPSGDTGFAEVAVNLNAGTFNRVLPFDVPVRVCGTVPAGSTSVAVQYVVSKAADISMDDACKVLAPPGARLQPDPAIPGRLDGTTFRVILPPLEAERYYAFCFERRAKVPDDVAAQFKAKARDVLDRGFAQLTTGDLTKEQSQKLRAELYQSLLQIMGADIALVKGTVFDTSPDYDELMVKFRGLVRRILEPQRRRDRIIEGDPNQGLPSLSGRQLDFKEALKAVHDTLVLTHLVVQLEKNAQTDPTLQALLAGRDLTAAFALIRADDDQLTLIAEGRDASEPAPDLLNPDQVATMAGHYNDSAAALGALANLIQKVIDAPPSSSLRAGFSDSDVTALRESIDPVQGFLGKAHDQASSLGFLAQDLLSALGDRATALDALADKVKIEAAGVEVVDGSTTGNFATAQNNYISADAGLVFAPQLKTGVSYIGMNFYFRPVNKDADLSQFGDFPRRFAVTLGLTVQSVADGGAGTTQTRQDLFGSQSLILGGGLRVTNSFRLATGAVVFKKKDRNPLVSRYSLATTYYFSLSFDLNVASAFKGGLGKLFGGS